MPVGRDGDSTEFRIRGPLNLGNGLMDGLPKWVQMASRSLGSRRDKRVHTVRAIVHGFPPPRGV
jgi:hypothetical protein